MKSIIMLNKKNTNLKYNMNVIWRCDGGQQWLLCNKWVMGAESDKRGGIIVIITVIMPVIV